MAGGRRHGPDAARMLAGRRRHRPRRDPEPEHVPLARWLTAFPSFGYLLSVRPDRTAAVTARFAERGIAAAGSGASTRAGSARVRDHAGAEAVVWDFAASPLMGCGRDGAEAAS